MTQGIRWTRVLLVGAGASALLLSTIWLTSRPSGTDITPLRPISCKRMNYVDRLHIAPQKLRAGSEVGGMGLFQYAIGVPEIPGQAPLETIVHPNVAIPAFGGWLLGGDRGEFGGELMFQLGDEGGPQFKLLDENIEEIYKMPFGYVATTGLAHMSFDSGTLFLITAGVDGIPAVSKMHELPASPQTSWLLESGDLLVNTNKGSVVLSKEKTIQTVKCELDSKDARNQ